MNTTKKRVLLGLAGFLSLGIATGAAAVLQTVNTYSDACSTLDGFPGFLQATGFIAKGDCKLDKLLRCPYTACETSVGRKGHCEARQYEKKFVCVCVRETTSGR